MSIRARAFLLERVKAAPPKDGEAAPKAKVYKFRANDGDFDRYQDRLNVAGWQLENFNALAGPILYNHDAGDGGFLGLGNKKVLPIGKARAYVESNALFVDIEFDSKDSFAAEVERKIEEGFLGAVSVRYVMKKYHDNERGGYDCEEQELLEISVVTIPGNQRALRAKSLKDMSAEELELFKAFAVEVAGHLKISPPDASASSPVGDAKKMTPEQIAAMQAENARLQKLAADAEAAKQAEAAKAVAAAKEAEEEARAQRAADAAVAKIIDAAKGNRGGIILVGAPGEGAKSSGVQVGDRVSKKSGIDFARFIKAAVVSKMTGKAIPEVLKTWGHMDLAKALDQGSFSGLGSTVRPQLASDFIEILRNKTVVRKAGARVLSMEGGSLTFDGQATSASASYGGSTSEIPKSEPSTNQPLVLSEKKLTALALIPNDLLRNSSIGADEFVLNDLLAVVALKEDEKFLYGTGTQFEPLGIAKQIKAAHKFAMTALATAGDPTIKEMKKQFNKVKKTLQKANAPMLDMAWFMSPSIETAVLDAVGPGGEGYNSLERELTERASIRNWKAYSTNQIPETATADLFAFDMAEVIIAESMNLEAEVFPNGTITNGGVTTSGISTDQSVIRIITKHDIGLRHPESGANVTGMTWGLV